MHALDGGSAGATEIGEICAQDPALAARILKLVNSAAFALPRKVGSIPEAVSLLGTDAVRGLVLSAHTFEHTRPAKPVAGVSVEAVQTHSFRVARLAKLFAKGTGRADDAFTAGLLHDVGQLILACGAGTVYADVVRVTKETGRSMLEVERELLGVTHSEVGAYLLGFWGLPLQIVEAVSLHHAPSEAASIVDATLPFVHAANALVSAADGWADPASQLDLAYLARMKLADRVEGWRAQTRGS